MLEQLNIYGRNMVEQAIYRLQQYEPPEGYFLAFSGGKDSVTIKALADMARVKYDAHYMVTSVDPPELVAFVKTFSDVQMDFPRYKDGGVVTMWNLIPKSKMPPTRLVRYCCQYFKETAGEDRFKVLGVRQAESVKRRRRGLLELADNRKGKYETYDIDAETIATEGRSVRILNPIVDWSDADVWQFIREYNVRYCQLYDEGFTRLGCVGCPLAGAKMQEAEFARWPTYKTAYIKAFQRMVDKRAEKEAQTSWKTGEDVMDWWLKKGVLGR